MHWTVMQKRGAGSRLVKALVRGHLTLWTSAERACVIHEEESRMLVEDALDRLRYNNHLIGLAENDGPRRVEPE